MGSGLAIVILAVDDLARAASFYKAAFACSETVTSPNYIELDLGSAIRIGVYERVAFGRNTGRTPPKLMRGDISRTELYFRVASLPSATADLEAAGAELLAAAQERPWGETVAYYADPDGNVIAVAARP
jgi:lactoylglutathione lyase